MLNVCDGQYLEVHCSRYNCQIMALHQHKSLASFLSEGKILSEHICEQSWSRHKAPMTVARRLHRRDMWCDGSKHVEWGLASATQKSINVKGDRRHR